ncbi:MAG: hypothetical protein JO282_14205 [Alphaproteobacteria bacterium]|nr:hypothetical protein [Alphaproteobacteria bacterium]
MIKLSTLFWLVLVSTTGFAMFAVKYGVQSLEDELNRTKRATIAEEHAIRADEAEWAYLTRPETLDEMNRRHLSLGPIATKQLRIGLSEIPMRAAPAAADVPPVVEPPAENALPTIPASTIAPASQEKPTEGAEFVKPAAAKTFARPVPPRRPRSLDELIAQVSASR